MPVPLGIREPAPDVELWLNSTHSKSLPLSLAYSALSPSFHSHAAGMLLHSTTTSNANEGTPSQQTTNESNARKRARERSGGNHHSNTFLLSVWYLSSDSLSLSEEQCYSAKMEQEVVDSATTDNRCELRVNV
ncbi:hypothetical protein DPX16_20252 [Anabarilius grahami]|uniref:Uncharacterized protein n=1 Tax=Anabarilius grahami TaxID=495550 RepID=A0A3N0XEC9_ANAGA|nr:hypothetical protein DPX16_20252 [Anabarilius grahami]